MPDINDLTAIEFPRNNKLLVTAHRCIQHSANGIYLVVQRMAANMDNRNFYIAGVGASAGGQQALRDFFENFQGSSDISFVIVTHLHRDHESILDKILSCYTNMEVRRIRDIEVVAPGIIYVMPENVKVVIRHGVLMLKPRESDEIINRSIDIFFQSLAEDQREKSIGIIFSGMGSDGAEGVKTIHEFGGLVLVQEPGSTAFKSMPDQAITHDHPHKILPPAQLASSLFDYLKSKRRATGKIIWQP